MNKICIYAICKNEVQFVDRWLDSMSEADYIVVLDTGSTDGTYEKLKSDPRVYRCEQKIICPWRFDEARNESLKLVPEDANILFCTDLDEILESGWGDIIRSKWVEGFHVRGHYKYAWSHDSEGNSLRIFFYDKLHDKNYSWKAPVHEMLASTYEKDYEANHTLNLFNEVYLHHFPDMEKSRSNYLELLELRKKETPDDLYGRMYLAHEYYYKGKYDESIAEFNDLIPKLREAQYSSVNLAACYLFMGDCYAAKGDKHTALANYVAAIQEDRTYRESYLEAAKILNDMQLYNAAIGLIDDAIKNTYRHYSWLEREESYTSLIDDLLSISYYYIGEYKTSYMHCLMAYENNSSNDRIKHNLEFIKQKLL